MKSKSIRKIVFNKYNGHCSYCGIKLDIDNFAIDHINPIFRKTSDKELGFYNRERGSNNIDNLNPSCHSCNSSKSTFTIEKWRSEINKKYGRLMKREPSFNLLSRLNIIKRNKKEFLFYFEKIQ